MTVDLSVTAVASAARRRRRPGPVRVSAAIAVAWLAAVVLAVGLAALIAPYDPLDQDISSALQLPSIQHLLGTDALGRDLLSRILYGGQPTLLGVLIAVVVAVGIGSIAGLAGGYVGGAFDRVLSVIADLLMSLPLILVLLAVFAIFPNNVAVAMGLFGLFTSSAIYRIVRGATMTITGELYITAARSTGLSDVQIIFRHLAPRLGGLIRVQASVIGAIALSTVVGLGFLGLDVAPPNPSWGSLVSEGFQYLASNPWLIVPPTVIIVLTILALGVLGDVAQSVPNRVRRQPSAVAGSAASVGVDVAAAADDVLAAAEASPALLTVRDVTVRTTGPAGVTLVEGVSFEVRAGEVVGLVGESGAGKSVTARALTRLDASAVVAGSVVFDGVDLLTLDESELRTVRGKQIAFIGQDPMSALDPLFRIQGQLAEALRTHRRLGRAAAKAEAIELLRAVRIPDAENVAKKYPFEISGGMAQRVAIALALAGEPRLLIADEPTTALDVTVQMEVLGLLKTLQRERGLAMVFVTHDWGVVADVCDRAITMYAGEIVESGRTDDVFALPSHPYTASLRLSDPHLQAVGVQLKSIPGSLPAPADRPSYCRFADRCSLVTDACRAEHPDLIRLPGDGRSSRCIRTLELREEKIHV